MAARRKRATAVGPVSRPCIQETRLAPAGDLHYRHRPAPLPHRKGTGRTPAPRILHPPLPPVFTGIIIVLCRIPPQNAARHRPLCCTTPRGLDWSQIHRFPERFTVEQNSTSHPAPNQLGHTHRHSEHHTLATMPRWRNNYPIAPTLPYSRKTPLGRPGRMAMDDTRLYSARGRSRLAPTRKTRGELADSQ